jgi:CheY-like chemotaxis protein
MLRTRLPTLVLAGAALASAWAVITTQRHTRASQLAQRQLAALTGAISSLARTSAPDDFLANAIRVIAEQLGARWVMLFLRDPVQEVLEVHLVFKDGQIVPRERATPNLAHPPDLALIDLLFGSMSGLDVIRAVRANGIDIPLVIITANTPQAETLEAQGATTCLFKPFDLDDLLACIARYIRTDSSPSRGVDNALPAS